MAFLPTIAQTRQAMNFLIEPYRVGTVGHRGRLVICADDALPYQHHIGIRWVSPLHMAQPTTHSSRRP